MKRLTGVTVILAGIGAVAGIFGMSEAGAAFSGARGRRVLARDGVRRRRSRSRRPRSCAGSTGSEPRPSRPRRGVELAAETGCGVGWAAAWSAGSGAQRHRRRPGASVGVPFGPSDVWSQSFSVLRDERRRRSRRLGTWRRTSVIVVGRAHGRRSCRPGRASRASPSAAVLLRSPARGAAGTSRRGRGRRGRSSPAEAGLAEAGVVEVHRDVAEDLVFARALDDRQVDLERRDDDARRDTSAGIAGRGRRRECRRAAESSAGRRTAAGSSSAWR